jgi:predicted nucleic acid-binding protein
MARHHGPVLVDTNVIIECWRVSAWKALTSGYAVETVQMCEIETQTGLQRRRPEQQIDAQVLRQTFKAVHSVSDAGRASALLRDDQMRFLDAGEQMLWAHAITRSDAWVVCGPDRASLRLGLRLGLRDRLVSLERLLSDAGHRPRIELKQAYTQKWLEQTLAQLASLEGLRP